ARQERVALALEVSEHGLHLRRIDLERRATTMKLGVEHRLAVTVPELLGGELELGGVRHPLCLRASRRRSPGCERRCPAAAPQCPPRRSARAIRRGGC